jgi:dipeptidase E
MFLNKEKTIYLSGGGDEKQSFLFDKFFFANLPKNAKFLYIPIALRGHPLYKKTQEWMNGILKLQKRVDLKFEIARNLQNYNFRKLKKFNSIYIGGGNTWNLLSEIKKNNFNKLLTKYTESHGQVYGGSAGAIILGKRIDTQDDINKFQIIDTKGLDLLSGYSVACHFKKKQEKDLKIWVKNNVTPLICLPEESGIIVKKNTILCIGEKPCVIYFVNGKKKDILPQKYFKLKNT